MSNRQLVNSAFASGGGGGGAVKATTTVSEDPLRKRIQRHYDVTAGHFLKLWGEHLHHGYYKSPDDSDQQAQLNQVLRLVESSGISAGSRVLDVGCGIGGTARFLAREMGCRVTAITNSRRQVEIARELTAADAAAAFEEEEKTKKKGFPAAAQPNSSSSSTQTLANTDFVTYPPPPPSPTSADTKADNASPPAAASGGAVRVLELDISQMREHLLGQEEQFDCVWISEVIFHLPDRQLFFDSAFSLLLSSSPSPSPSPSSGSSNGGRLVIADICRTVTDPIPRSRADRDLAAIRRDMLCPQLGTAAEYVAMARESGFRALHDPVDITRGVVKTWDASLPISAILYAISQGRDTVSYLWGMRSMKRAYRNGLAAYTIFCFEKP